MKKKYIDQYYGTANNIKLTYPIIDLTIEAPFGTYFYLNGNTAFPIYIKQNEIFKLNVENYTEITSINFGNNLENKIIIDYIYLKEESPA